jgi:hypothetical protein
MRTTTVIIGWTQHERLPESPGTMLHRVARQPDYTPFWDGYRAGQPQHTITFELEVPDNATPAIVAQEAFTASNAPYPLTEGTVAARILAAIQATGYRGREAHYSLSVGDTVEVDGVKLSCEGSGWEPVVDAEASR